LANFYRLVLGQYKQQNINASIIHTIKAPPTSKNKYLYNTL